MMDILGFTLLRERISDLHGHFIPKFCMCGFASDLSINGQHTPQDRGAQCKHPNATAEYIHSTARLTLHAKWGLQFQFAFSEHAIPLGSKSVLVACLQEGTFSLPSTR